MVASTHQYLDEILSPSSTTTANRWQRAGRRGRGFIYPRRVCTYLRGFWWPKIKYRSYVGTRIKTGDQNWCSQTGDPRGHPNEKRGEMYWVYGRWMWAAVPKLVVKRRSPRFRTQNPPPFRGTFPEPSSFSKSLLLFKNTFVEYAFNPHLGITFRQDSPNIARNARCLLKTRRPPILVFDLCEPPSFSIGDLRTPLVWRGSPRFLHQYGYCWSVTVATLLLCSTMLSTKTYQFLWHINV